MARTNQDLDTRSRKHCQWTRAPATGTTFEGLLFCIVGLFMVVTVALPLHRGEITNADRSHDPTVATPLLHTVVASAGADTRRPAEATVE
jgi:hypothetical protein